VRISGIEIPNNKRLVIALTYICGIGLSRAKHICKCLNLDESIRVKDITDEQGKEIQKFIEENYIVESELKREVNLNINALKKISCYKGFRHIAGLPANGQNTRSNARTRRRRKTAVKIGGKK
jgi:small subunit ribosomal protein S13